MNLRYRGRLLLGALLLALAGCGRRPDMFHHFSAPEPAPGTVQGPFSEGPPEPGPRAGAPAQRAAPARTRRQVAPRRRARREAAPKSPATSRRAVSADGESPNPRQGRAPKSTTESPRVRVNLLSALEGELKGNISGRADLRLSLGDFTLRAQALDRRYSPFKEGWEADWDSRLPRFSGGLYHRGSGSRLVQGVIEEWGLPARLGNVWAKSLPWTGSRKPLGADLKTAYTVNGTPETFLYLSGPGASGQGFSLRPYGSLWLGEDGNPAFGAGIEARYGTALLRGEAFHTRKKLPPTTASTWFSETPPLPERDFEIYGAGLLFTSPWFSLAADGALSRTFGWGEDYYGNLALSFGSKTWQLGLAADAAGDRYNDRAGNSVGAGFRAGARLEVKQKRSGLFRIDAAMRSPGPGLPFNRSSFSVYERFPVPPRNAASFFRPLRISFSVARDARNAAKILDSADAALRWRLGPLGMGFGGSVDGLLRVEGESPVEVSPFPLALDHEFSAARASGEISWSPGIFQFRLKTGRTWSAKKDPLQDASLSVTLGGKRGRIGLTVNSPDFPHDWGGSLSLRLVF